MKYLIWSISSFLILGLLGCKKEETPATKKVAKITSFKIGDQKATISHASKKLSLATLESDLTKLAPTIVVSHNGVVTPKSGEAVDFTKPVVYTVKSTDGSEIKYTAEVTSAVKPFAIGDKKYEIILINKTWVEAAKVAKARGGYLAEIGSAEEQKGVYNALKEASIKKSATVAPDGGNASYVWLGGNDIAEEGRWIWDGENAKDGGVHFWQGKKDGKAIEGRYVNWGKEPDDFGSGQDALGLALTSWPLGVAGQWNDVSEANRLFFVVEYD